METKKLNVFLNQSYDYKGEQKENSTTVTVNVINADKFSAKQFRKIVQHGVNNVLEIEGIGICKGRRFKLRAEFDGLILSEYSTFYNSAQRVKAKFNRILKQRLNVLAMDVKDIMTAKVEAKAELAEA